jgi:YD repeat-containing protein
MRSLVRRPSRVKYAIALALLIAFVSVALPSEAASGTATYSYDALGRLVQVTYNNGTTIAYTYDTAGNRVSVVVTCGTGGC